MAWSRAQRGDCYTTAVGALLGLVLLAPLAHADPCAVDNLQTPVPNSPALAWSPYLSIDNDFVERLDREYTHGVRLALRSEDLDSFADPRLPRWIERLNRAWAGWYPVGSRPCGQLLRQSFFIGQALYTPDDPDASQLLGDQRPYAAWLYAGIGYDQRQGQRLRRAQLSLGLVGPQALGEASQRLIHELGGWVRFQGWDNQLHNEPTLQGWWEQRYKLSRPPAVNGWGNELIGRGGVALGNVATHASLGAEWRFGWHLPDDFGSANLPPFGDFGAPGDGGGGRGWRSTQPRVQFFTALDGRGVVRDLFLDGNSFRSSPRVDKQPWVADWILGVAVQLGALELNYSRIARSREYRQQPAGHRYGSFTLSWRRLF